MALASSKTSIESLLTDTPPALRSRLGQLHQFLVQATARGIPARLRPGSRLNQRLHNLFFARAKSPLHAHQGIGQTTHIIKQHAQGITPRSQRITQRLHKRAVNPLRRGRHIITNRPHRLRKRLNNSPNTLGRLNQLPRSKPNIRTHAHNLQCD